MGFRYHWAEREKRLPSALLRDMVLGCGGDRVSGVRPRGVVSDWLNGTYIMTLCCLDLMAPRGFSISRDWKVRGLKWCF